MSHYLSTEMRQRGRFAGFSLYVTDTDDIRDWTQCYKDGPQLPPLNFKTTCAKFARYVIFYNERLDKITYPIGYEVDNVPIELCEVAVQGTYVKKPALFKQKTKKQKQTYSF